MDQLFKMRIDDPLPENIIYTVFAIKRARQRALAKIQAKDFTREGNNSIR